MFGSLYQYLYQMAVKMLMDHLWRMISWPRGSLHNFQISTDCTNYSKVFKFLLSPSHFTLRERQDHQTTVWLKWHGYVARKIYDRE